MLGAADAEDPFSFLRVAEAMAVRHDPRACNRLQAKADKVCRDVPRSPAHACASKCEGRMESLADQCADQKKCPTMWRKYVRTRLCARRAS